MATNSADGRERPIEHFWLCSDCAASMTVELSEAGEVRLVPIELKERKPVASAAPRCNLAAHAS